MPKPIRRRVIAIAISIVVVVAAVTIITLSVRLTSQNSKAQLINNDEFVDNVSNDDPPASSTATTSEDSVGPDNDNFDEFSNDVTTETPPPLTMIPSFLPSLEPSTDPSSIPTLIPSLHPTSNPTILPSHRPTRMRTETPSLVPSSPPSGIPSQLPSSIPSFSKDPTFAPIDPTDVPTPSPTHRPTPNPTPHPTDRPTTMAPTPSPISEESQLEPPPDNIGGVGEENTFTVASAKFYAIGDVPYSNQEAEELVEQIQALPEDAEFLIHVGDIRSARDGSRCTPDEYESVAEILLLSHAPVFLVMGDNEYNDCPNVRQGHEYWKTTFQNFEQNWQHNFDVIRQEDRPENFAFIHKNALYVGLNLVGGRVQSRSEWNTRFQDQLDWFKELLDMYVASITTNIDNHQNVIKTVILFGHADPSSDHSAFFDPLVEYIQEDDIVGGDDFVFLYLNGDSHVWHHEPNYFGLSKFLRMQVEGGTRDPPVAITVNTMMTAADNDDDGLNVSPSDVFLYDRRK